MLVAPVVDVRCQSCLRLNLHCRILPGSLLSSPACMHVGADVKAVKSIERNIRPLLASSPRP